jgi:hypothetical protein
MILWRVNSTIILHWDHGSIVLFIVPNGVLGGSMLGMSSRRVSILGGVLGMSSRRVSILGGVLRMSSRWVSILGGMQHSV